MYGDPCLKKKNKDVYLLTPNQSEKIGSQIKLAFISLHLFSERYHKGRGTNITKKREGGRLLTMLVYIGTMVWHLVTCQPIPQSKGRRKLHSCAS